MTEWVLIIWTITCGWSCNKDNVQQFAVYETQSECDDGLLDWTIIERTRYMTDEFRGKHHDRGGKCLVRPVTAK